MKNVISMPEVKVLDVLKIITEHSPFGMAVIDGQTLGIRWANKSYYQLLKKPFKSGEIVDLYLEDFLPRSENKEIFHLLDKVKKNKEPLMGHRCSYVNYTGSKAFWNLSLLPVHNEEDEEPYILIHVHPLEGGELRYHGRGKSIIQHEKALAAMVESSYVAIIGTTVEGKIESWNKGAQYLYGYSKEEIKGKNISTLVSIEEGGESILPINKEILKSDGFVRIERIGVNKEGKFIPISINISPILDENGELTSLVSVHRDISGKKELEKELIRLDRLNLLGEMAAGISHEIRNPLTTVRGFLQLLEKKKEYEKDREYFKVMIEELDRANYIITEFLSLGKKHVAEASEKNNLNDIIKALIPLIEADAIGSDTCVELDLGDIPEISVNEKAIRQVILNLSRNGIEAMEGGGVLTIKTYCSQEEVILAIKDNGKGIDPKIIDKLGTPFFTTKKQGTGLGLAICNSIINKHNGKITVESNCKGTTFFVHFQKE